MCFIVMRIYGWSLSAIKIRITLPWSDKSEMVYTGLNRTYPSTNGGSLKIASVVPLILNLLKQGNITLLGF